MKLSNILAKITYWNVWFPNNKKTLSMSSLKRKLYNPRYSFIYLFKSEEQLDYLLPNVITIDYHDFILRINMLNKNQHIVLLNNIHEIPDIYNKLKELGFKVSVLNWGKYKNINDIFKVILKIK